MPDPTLRRYYLGQRRLALEALDTFEAGLWRAKQEALAWPALPADFPARAALIAALYTTVRDLDGATVSELEDNGLSTRDARRVLAAMESWKMIPTILKTYQRQDGRYAQIYNAPLLGSAAQAAAGPGDTFEMGELSSLYLKLDVTAVTGTNPTLDVVVETSQDGVTWWPLLRFGQKTAISNEERWIAGCGRFVRANWATGGTLPVFTFSISGEAK